MTALIYKAALPTYTSLEDLVANADENLVLNDAGTAYELEPGQSGASVAGVGDRLHVSQTAATPQTCPMNAATKVVMLNTVNQTGGSSFEWRQATHDILVLRDCLITATFEWTTIQADVSLATAQFQAGVVLASDPTEWLDHVTQFMPYAMISDGGYFAGVAAQSPYAVHVGDVLEMRFFPAGTGGPPVLTDCQFSLTNIGSIEPAA